VALIAGKQRLTLMRLERPRAAVTALTCRSHMLQCCVSLARQKTPPPQHGLKMGRLVDDLLFLARSEARSIMIERTDVVLQEIIGDVLIDGQNLRRRKDVRLRPTQPEAPVVVFGDPDRIRQALLIALDNAIRLAPSRAND
jgi:signal transduction histidine kinase